MTRDNYLRQILRLYRLLPHTPQRFHKGDRAIVDHLFDEDVPVRRVEAALLLGSARRVCRDPQLPALEPIRSIAYFLPVLRQLPTTPAPHGYLEYLRRKLSIAIHDQETDLTAN